MVEFKVIDNKTGVEADKVQVAREKWVKARKAAPLGFVLMEDGALFLALDDCRLVDVPADRFEVVAE